jgi:hypothetical protein
MQQILKYLPWITTAILLIVLWGSVTKCSKNKEMLDQEQAYTEKFRIEKTKDGKTIALQSENLVSNKKLIESLRDTIKQFGEITSQVKVETNTIIKEVAVPIEVPVYITQNGINYLKTPADFIYEDRDKWFSLKGTITDKGTIQMREMTYRNSLSIYAGWKKRTLKDIFKKRERQIGVVDLNPYSNVTQLRNFTIKERQSRFGIGIGIGGSLSKHGLQPSINFGLQYNIIRF